VVCIKPEGKDGLFTSYMDFVVIGHWQETSGKHHLKSWMEPNVGYIGCIREVGKV